MAIRPTTGKRVAKPGTATTSPERATRAVGPSPAPASADTRAPASADTRAAVAAAAQAEFIERGFDGARMQAIANRAGVNKALLHYHFQSKETLFAHVFAANAQQVFPRVQLALEQAPDFVSAACAFVDIYIGHLRNNPQAPFFFISVARSNPQLFAKVVARFPQELIAAYQRSLRRREVARHDPLHLFISIMSMCAFPFLARPVLQQLFSMDEATMNDFFAQRAAEVKHHVQRLLQPMPTPSRAHDA